MHTLDQHGMEYDTSMFDRPVKLRTLPNGIYVDASVTSLEGHMLELTLPDGHTGFSPGQSAEMESESMLCLGEVRQCNGSKLMLLIEHSLDRARLASLQKAWQ
jgi:hypothetical protein